MNELARESLQSFFEPEIWVKGEIHGLKFHAKSGHLYFDLVEKAPSVLDGYIAKVSCAFFRGAYVKWRAMLSSLGINNFDLDSGIEIKLKARIDLFVKEGRYQLIVSEIDPTYTFGAIAKKREQTIQSLRMLGLMDKNKGLAFPELPLHIGLITSEGSAAYNDFLHLVRDSGYGFSITLFDAHMQGENTVSEVIRGISLLQNHDRVDTIAIIRGGGAKTDLFSFDDIAICKAIAQCPKPVVTGIGHEIDVSVADLLAHTYCVTPTDAARLYISKADEVGSFLQQASQEISFRSREIMQRTSERLRMNAAGLDHLSRRWMVTALSLLKGIAFHLHTHAAKGLARRQEVLVQSITSLRNHLGAVLRLQQQNLAGLPPLFAARSYTHLAAVEEHIRRHHTHLTGFTQAVLVRHQERMEHLHSLASLMDPLETLKRGFSITVDGEGKVIMDAGPVRNGTCITTKLAIGKLVSVVKDKE